MAAALVFSSSLRRRLSAQVEPAEEEEAAVEALVGDEWGGG